MSEIRINACTAETLYISHPTASFGTFCFNSIGDLFLSSDWGFHCYAWRAFGDNFKLFLASCNEEYILGKFETNYTQQTKKKMPPMMKKNVGILVTELIKWLSNQGKPAEQEIKHN